MKKIIFVLTLLCSIILGDEYAQVRANVENGICKDSDIPILDRLCQAGNGDACNDLVNGYISYASPSVKELTDGRKYCGITRDKKKQFFYAELGCKFGNPESCGRLGFYYHEKKDHCKAVEFDEKACNGGAISYCNNVGVLYTEGHCGHPIDYNKALSYYKKACKAGNKGACGNYKIIKNKMR